MPKRSPKSRVSIPTPPVAPLPKRATRIRDHNTVLAAILRDERLSPRLQVFTGLIYRYFSIGMKDGKEVPMSPQETKDKELLYNIIIQQYGNPKSIQWVDREDVSVSVIDPQTQGVVDATDKIREAFEAAMRPVAKESQD